MKTVIVCDAIHPIGFELLRAQKDICVVDATKVPKDELLDILPQADVAITRSSTECGEAFINAASNLKALVRAGVGVDNVDIEGCSKKGIIVMNVPTANTIAAVEMTMCHLLNSARKFVLSVNDLKIDHIWKREKWYGNELYGKTLGIIGFGNIGSRVGIRAKAFGMNIVTYDPYIDPSKASDLGIKYTSDFDEILACDFITIHTPKNKETINMITSKEIAKMKDGVRLINVARGGLYNEDDLKAALDSGKVAYAGIDVFAKEPANNHPLLDCENLSATPHLGANTYESQRNIATQAADQAMNAARGICYPNALNLPIKTEDLPAFIAPFIELTSKLAYMASSLNKTQIKSIKIEASGEISKYINSLLTFAIVGALKDTCGESINYVNAKFVAEEKNIKISNNVLPTSAYKNQVSVSVVSDNDNYTISGTIFDEKDQRIVNINGFKTDFIPKGRMIIFKNKDVPGVIYQLSSILAKENINIADFRLGRGEGGFAMAAILIDHDINEEILEELRALEPCVWAKYVEL